MNEYALMAMSLLIGAILGGCGGYSGGVATERRAACKAGVAEWVVVGDGGETMFRYKSPPEAAQEWIPVRDAP